MNNILLIEDDLGDIELMKEAFNRSKLKLNMLIAYNGLEALEIIRAEKLSLVILDLNLPKMDGREVLQRIKKDTVLSKIPVVTLTGSKLDEDVQRTHDFGANAFMVKPNKFEDYDKIIQTIESFLD